VGADPEHNGRLVVLAPSDAQQPHPDPAADRHRTVIVQRTTSIRRWMSKNLSASSTRQGRMSSRSVAITIAPSSVLVTFVILSP
jgi:hypothetical protein